MSSIPSPRQAPPGISAEQRRGIRRTTRVVWLAILAIYFGYMIYMLIRMHR
jgi:hypothetical protein